MTTPIHGADALELRRTAQAMCDAAEELIATDLRVSGALGSLTWNGPDAMRARLAWDTEHGPALYTAAGALARAGEQLLREADEQEQTSAAGTAAGAPPGAVAFSMRSTLAAELFSIRTVLEVLTPSAETVERIRGGINAANTLNDLNTLTEKVRVPPALGRIVGALGVASDVKAFSEARAQGDVAGQIRSGGSLATTGVGVVHPVAGAAASIVWEGGWGAYDLGQEAAEAIAQQAADGTGFGANFQRRNDAILDTVGAWGMLATPGTLIVSGAETAWQAVTQDNAAEAPGSGDDVPGSGVGGR